MSEFKFSPAAPPLKTPASIRSGDSSPPLALKGRRAQARRDTLELDAPQGKRQPWQAPTGTALAGSVPLGNARGTAATATMKVSKLETRAQFDARATAGAGAGSAGMSEVKFLVDQQTGTLFFLSPQYPYHFNFARDVLGFRGSLDEFNRQAYRDPNRRFLPGTVTAYDNFVSSGPTSTANAKGRYGISFWSTDPVGAPLIKEAYAALTKAMPFAAKQLVYHPGGQTQESLLDANAAADRKALTAAKIPILTNTELAKGFDFSALNTGATVGVLKIVAGPGAAGTLTRRDIALYTGDVPADPPPLAGMLTPKPQTYLSHAALKARQDDTPYAYARDILKDPKVRSLDGKVVKLEVTAKGLSLRAATQKEADEHYEAQRPKKGQKLSSDLTVKTFAPLSQLKYGMAKAFGSKAVNVAELGTLRTQLNRGRKAGEPLIDIPDGFALPASFFADFMKTAKYDVRRTLAQRLTEMLRDPKWSDPATRAALLADFQAHIENAQMPAALHTQTAKLQQQFQTKYPNENMRLRSSSNSEDLTGFNGAGLFDSFTFRFKDQDKPGKSLDARLQKVFASVFNERAVNELDYYRVDITSVNMAELAMPNEDGEIANGVVRWGGAIPGWESMTLNAQVGESLVTNPEGGAIPDQLVVANYGFNGELELQYEQRTNQTLPAGRKTVLTDAEVRALFRAMKQIQAHFKALYTGGDDFAIECEFKVTSDGTLSIKQARPWVS